MSNKIFTLPRAIFVVIFGYINANISAYFAYTQSRADVLDYLMSGLIAIFCLAIGGVISYYFVKEQNVNNKEITSEVMGLILATIIEIGINTWLIFSKI